MREVKFRAWKKYTQKYLEADDLLMNLSNSNLQNLAGGTFRPSDVVIEQYTGIKDKNGVEIYEGDIVAEITQFDDDEPDLYEIVYNEDGHYPAFDLKGWTGEVNGISELLLTCGIEVVGNIHENEDLLEEQS